jgi:hypothetical protein
VIPWPKRAGRRNLVLLEVEATALASLSRGRPNREQGCLVCFIVSSGFYLRIGLADSLEGLGSCTIIRV